MSQERQFLSQLLESALSGDTAKVKSLTGTYAARHSLSLLDVLSQFKDGNKRTALHFAVNSPPRDDDDDDDDDESCVDESFCVELPFSYVFSHIFIAAG